MRQTLNSFSTTIKRIIEFVKGNKVAGEILNRLSDVVADVYINDIVFSEFIFHYISLRSGLSPLAMKGKKKLTEFIDEKEPKEFIDQFKVLEVNEEIVEIAYDFIRRYSMLPNDAIILATCRFHRIDLLISLDRDFERVCRQEGLKFASSSKEIK